MHKVIHSEQRLNFEASDGTASHLALHLAEPATGTDLAVLYMHGFGSCQSGEKADFFRRRLLARGIAVCSFDFQGHGESGGSMLQLTLSRNLEDVGRVHDFLRQHGYRRVVLVGSSMGGASALWYASRQGEEVEAALTLAPALEMAEGMERWAGPAGMEQWQRDGRHEFAHDLVTCELGWELLEDLRTYDPAQLAAELSCPTLILQGMQDASVDWWAITGFVASCPWAPVELHVFGDGDHRLVDRLDHLWSLMAAFLDARGVTPGVVGARPAGGDP